MILIDYKDRRPIYEQVEDRLQELMMLGVLEQDSQLPSVRNLATELSINPNTIQRAYVELERQGFIYSVKGKGSFVSDIRRIQDSKKVEIEKQMGELIWKAKCIAMTKEDLIATVEDAYDRGGDGR